MKRVSAFYPILLVIFPILSLYAYNIEEVSARDLAFPLLIAIAGVLILLLLLRLVIKSRNKIALVVTWLVVLFFSYGYVRDVVFDDAKVSLKPNVILLSVWFVLLIIEVFLVLRARRDFDVFTKFLRAATIALVVVVVVFVGVGVVGLERVERGETGETVAVADSPDIYYIVLDMYTSNNALRELLDYDNSEFTDSLADKGFFVAVESHSNYRTTYISTASCLNMDYLSRDRSVLEAFGMVEDSEASRFLRARGYRYVYVSGGVDFRNMKRYADVRTYKGAFGFGISAFLEGLCDTTVLAPFARALGGLYGANAVLYAFDALAKIPNIEESTFVYAHVLCPHPPWFFTVDGPRDLNIFGPSQDEMVKEGYLGNLEYINMRVDALIDGILSKSDIPPIIILQGDHGLWWVEEQTQHYEILNAYYLSDGGSTLLYNSISPVNSFRVIFNHYFGTDYKLLEDRREE